MSFGFAVVEAMIISYFSLSYSIYAATAGHWFILKSRRFAKHCIQILIFIVIMYAVALEEGAPELRMGAPSLMAAAVAATMSSPAAMALVDERMSTEGTGLPFGLSNNLLGCNRRTGLPFGLSNNLLRCNRRTVKQNENEFNADQ